MVINDAELFFTTLWSIIPPVEQAVVQMGLTDCHRIKYDGRNFTSQDYEALHTTCVNWLTVLFVSTKYSDIIDKIP